MSMSMSPSKRPKWHDVSFPPSTTATATAGKIKIGINGFGTLGRSLARVALHRDDIQVVAINDPRLTARDMVYMFCTDNVEHTGDISFKNNDIFLLGGKDVIVYSYREAEEIPWDEVGAEFIVESTGNFTDKDKAAAHLKGGAKKVIVSDCSEDAPMFIMGVNEHEYTSEFDVISTTNHTICCIAPIVKIIQDRFGIGKMLITRFDSFDLYTSYDVPPSRKLSMPTTVIPSIKEVSKALGKVFPSLDGKLTEKALSRSMVNVSYVALDVNLENATTSNQIKTTIKEEFEGKLKGISCYIEDESTKNVLTKHITSDSRSTFVDAHGGIVFGGNFLRLYAMNNNYWGYSSRVMDMIAHMVKMCSDA